LRRRNNAAFYLSGHGARITIWQGKVTMEAESTNEEQQHVTENRCPADTPLCEAELENFDKFYRGFLNKKLEDKLSLLKGISLLRRGDLRQYVQYAVLFQSRYEKLIPVKQRDLLLSFPSVNKEIYHLIFACSQSYGMAGETAVGVMKDQVGDHLDRTEMFRIDLDTLLCNADAIIPEHKEMLTESFNAARAGTGDCAFKFNIVMLADHAILSVVKSTDRNSTQMIGQVRDYLDKTFRDKLEDNLVEFFVAGGGFIRTEGERLIIGGRSQMFDPTFAEADKPLSELYAGKFLTLKYQLAQQILKTEFPQYEFNIKGSAIQSTNSDGHLSLIS
jgi:hypothetical protein